MTTKIYNYKNSLFFELGMVGKDCLCCKVSDPSALLTELTTSVHRQRIHLPCGARVASSASIVLTGGVGNAWFFGTEDARLLNAHKSVLYMMDRKCKGVDTGAWGANYKRVATLTNEDYSLDDIMRLLVERGFLVDKTWNIETEPDNYEIIL
jgi:hypothetical protein